MAAANTSQPVLVMLGVDGNDHSVYAFDWYVQNFHKAGNRLLLVHISEPITNMSLMSNSKQQELLKRQNEKIAALKEKFMDKMQIRGIEGDFLCINSDKPGHAMVECAETKMVTFVVIGTRGQSKVRRTIMGSVSDYIVHNCHAPVLLCRHKRGWEKSIKETEKLEKKEKEKRGKELKGKRL